MIKGIKVGDVLRRVTDTGSHFTMGNDYEVKESFGDYVEVCDDDGFRYLLSSESVRVNFTILRETPRLVVDPSEIKTGSLIRVVNASPDLWSSYENGDIFEVGLVWDSGGGITTTQGIEMFEAEYEKVTDEVKTDAVKADAVNQPSHYTNGKFETIEVIEEFTKGYTDGFIAYDVGNVVKYIARAPYKHDTPLEDLRKAARYLDYAIKRQEELERD